MRDWQPARLADLIDIRHGFAFRGEYFASEGPGDVLMTPGNFVIGGGFQWGKRKYYNGPVPAEYVLNPGDLVVTMTDLSKAADTLGYAAVVPDAEERLLHNQRIGKVLRRSPNIDQGFLHWLMRTQSYRNEVLASLTGSTVKHTSPKKILAFQFMLPSLHEQEAIASVLGALDDKIELNRRMNETLEAMARAIFKDWFVDFGPTRTKMEGREPYLASDIWALFPGSVDNDLDVPLGWGRSSVHSQANWVNGAAYKNMHFSVDSDGLPVIKIAELKSGVTAQTKRTSTQLGERYRINDRELLFSWSGNPDTSIDAFVWIGGEAWLNQHIFAVRENGRASLTFLYYMLKSFMPEFAEIARNKQTTGLGHVTKADMERMLVATGDVEIREAFERLAKPIHDRLIANLFENRTLAATRDLLLPKLMSGEIRIRDAEKVLEAAA